jgi:hypothetical protein
VGMVEIDPRRWGWTGTWCTEPATDALASMPPFGRRFFDAVFEQFPDVAAKAIFLRWTEQPDDVYALLFWPGGAAGAQIDPALEYIIVWSAEGHAEFGDWGTDQVPPAVEYVRQLVLGQTPTA